MNGSDSAYVGLLAAFPPRPITSEEQYRITQAEIDRLIDKGNLTLDEQDYLTLLGTLMMAYEEEQEPEVELRGIDLLKALIEEERLRQKDLIDIFKTESIVSAVLHRRRSLTAEHIDKLARRFRLPHELFFEPG